MSENLLASEWRQRLEELGSRRRDVALVGAVVGALVFGGMGIAARGSAPRIAPPARATPSPSGSPLSGAVVVVHVAGAVRTPGIVELPPGARVADAIELAGGALPKADLDGLNLAEVIVDGAQILVPAKGSASNVPAPTASASASGLIDLNAADQTALETVPGLGPVKAAAIVSYRTEIGSFESIDQLLEVNGIGPATLDLIRPFVSL